MYLSYNNGLLMLQGHKKWGKLLISHRYKAFSGLGEVKNQGTKNG